MHKALQDYINAEFDKLEFGAEPANLYDPIRYMLSVGGKRLRPLLTLMGYTLFKDDYEKAVYPALGIELFHNFTLMHDDIMDDAPLRRGEATVHKKWNENVAILSGDVTFVRAYQLVTSVEDQYLRKVIERFNDTAALVCEGQQMDMDFELMHVITVDDYLKMIRCKTAALLGFSLQLGAVLAGAGEENEKILYDTGINMGLAFQIKDDLLDVYGDAQKFGKRKGGDITANKKTFLTLHALESAEDTQKKELINWLENEPSDNEQKIEAVKSIYDRLGVKQRADAVITQYYNHAVSTLEQVQATPEQKGILLDFFKTLMQREQ